MENINELRERLLKNVELSIELSELVKELNDRVSVLEERAREKRE